MRLCPHVIIWLYCAIQISFTQSIPRNAFTYSKEKIPEHCGRSAFDEFWAKYFTEQAISKRIVGGTLSKNGEWPWLISVMFHQTAEQAKRLTRKGSSGTDGQDDYTSPFMPRSLVINLPDGSRIFHLCGATLIHPQWALSAAHCFQPNGDYPDLSTDPERWIARVGEHDMLDESFPHYDMELERIFVFPRYHAVSQSGDIALLKFRNPVPIGRFVNIACLPTASEELEPGKECYSVGWGHETQDATNISTILKHVPVSVVPKGECIINYATLRQSPEELPVAIEDTMICAGHSQGGKDSCQFDSGGPLVCQLNGQWRVMGIISFGHGCGLPKFPGVHTKVSAYIRWIKYVTNVF
ncbi:unnamed protein product [Dicrocoelium dendriticum]|nr:unnamed protein product [Dicrocoelium dendriticum]